MTGNVRLFVVGGLLVAAALALFASPFANSNPDGLERVAKDKGFSASEREHALKDGPVADYSLRGVDDERVGTGIAGLIGVTLTFGIGTLFFGVLRTFRKSPHAGDLDSG
ncbi:MAG TPA: PDGLE domain-containing protein [Actinomycetota bacterium]|nr:PDGLE domain-containing protein [Actinomycetota bacterium]